MTERAVAIHNAQGTHPVVLICEHASAFIPPSLDNLGLDEKAASSHAAWDPGAASTARHLSGKLDAVLIESTVSRLVYDCNRPPEAASAMPSRSEIYDIPGNARLSADQRQMRIDHYYRPFEKQLTTQLAAHPCPPVLVTMHSFTPVYNGIRRELEIGILHDDDSRLADAMLNVATGFDIRRNEPYGPADGVTHTLRQHGVDHGRLNVMIEIRNDLIESDAQCLDIANHLSQWLTTALTTLSNTEQLPNEPQPTNAGARR